MKKYLIICVLAATVAVIGYWAKDRFFKSRTTAAQYRLPQ